MNDINTLTITCPDDWHLHVRDEAMLATVVPCTARQFARAIIMPNLPVPITTVAAATAYQDRILKAVPHELSFQPLMTAYLTEQLNPDELRRGYEAGVLHAVKLYPAGATTNSASGIVDVGKIRNVFEALQEIGMPLLVHGEVTTPTVDIFDREAVFIEQVMIPLLADFPALKVVFEHITTADAIDFVESSGHQVAATITAHHLMINRNAMFQGGLRPHMYCLPVAKREKHRLALRRAATSGSKRFFLGTDSAPHAVTAKENACGCAGIFTALNAMEFYAQVFEEENALDKLEVFASVNGPTFYGLPVNTTTLTLARVPQTVAEHLVSDDGVTIHPFGAGEPLRWSISAP